jgi:riboflavin synthase
MFTGLIEDLGTVRTFHRGGTSGRITVATALPMAEIAEGDSIAVNGVCLTVVSRDDATFIADVSPESLTRTGLGELRGGSRVNLERALRLSDRLGGHLVSGHVDAMGIIKGRSQDQNAVRFTIEAPPAQMPYLVEKGSVAVDGISLTVNAVGPSTFDVAVIPHSLANTTLQWRDVNARVNIETDILGKYVERLLRKPDTSDTSSGTDRLDLEFLARHGFL